MKNLYVHVLFVSILLVFAEIFLSSNLFLKDYGYIDFKEYWSSFHILKTGLNPYDPLIMRAFQLSLFGNEVPLMMWNPPWLLFLMAPILIFPYAIAGKLWLLTQVCCFLVSIFLLFDVYRNQKREIDMMRSPWGILSYLLVMSIVFFSPVFNSFFYGQIGCLLLLGVTLLFWGLEKNKLLGLISGFFIMSVKPHLFFILGVPVLWEFLRKKDYKKIFAITLTAVLAFIFSYVLHAELPLWWIRSFSREDFDIVPGAYQWISANFGGALREYVHPDFVYLNFTQTLFLSIALLMYLIFIRPSKINWKIVFPPLLFVSVYFAPFGWFFDQSVLFPIHLFIILTAYRSKLFYIIVLLVLLQILSHLYMHLYLKQLVEMYWYAPVLFFLWLLTYRLSRKEVELR